MREQEKAILRTSLIHVSLQSLVRHLLKIFAHNSISVYKCQYVILVECHLQINL